MKTPPAEVGCCRPPDTASPGPGLHGHAEARLRAGGSMESHTFGVFSTCRHLQTGWVFVFRPRGGYFCINFFFPWKWWPL